MTATKQTIPGTDLERWDVNAIVLPFGVGRKLGQVSAITRTAAEIIARGAYGEQILVTLSGGRPRRRREQPRDLGSSRSSR